MTQLQKKPSVNEEMILSLINVCKTYSGGHQAVRNVSFELKKGTCLGVVGESGSGKSTLARCVLTLEKMQSGQIYFAGREIQNLDKVELKKVRQRMQIVFQNPTASFNSKLTIQKSLLEPIKCQKKKASFLVEGKDQDIAAQLLEKVNLPSSFLNRYPKQLSGGQKQLVAIARAISVKPDLIVLDEPTASLDVSIQARTLNLLKDLQQELGLSYLFISHDLSAVNFMCERMLVMRSGEVVDQFDRQDLFAQQRHPYTKTLLSFFNVI